MRAALALALVTLAAAACSPDGTRPPPPAPVVRVAITAPDTAGLIGRTLSLSATAYDSSGAAVAGATVRWVALFNTLRGTVDSLGQVRLGPSGGDFLVAATEPISGRADTVGLHAAREGELKWVLTLGDSSDNVDGPALGPDGTISVLTLPNPSGAELADLHLVSPQGRELWRLRLDRTGYNSHLAGPDGTIYVAGRTVRAISPQGVVRWSHVMQAASAAVFTSAALAPGGALVVAAGEPGPTAFDPATGDSIWAGPASPIGAWLVPPTIDGGTVWIKKTEDSLYAFSLATGQIGRRIADPDSGVDKRSFGVGPVPVSGTLYLPTRFRLAAFDSSGTLRWLTDNRGSGVSEPVVDAAGAVYVQTDADGLLALDPATGTWRWRRLAARPRWIWYGGPALAQGGTIYCAALDGFYVYNTSGTLLWSYQTTEGGTTPVPFTGAPVIAPDGTVYTYTDTALYAFWGLYPPEPNSPWPMWRHDAQRTGRAR